MTSDPPAGGLIASGNVGIGTTSPASKLHVSSSKLIVDGTGGKIQFVDGSTQATAPGPKAIQVFTANGTCTPTAGATIAIVECVGGGGGSFVGGGCIITEY